MDEEALLKAEELLKKLAQDRANYPWHQAELANSYSLLATAQAATRQAKALERIAQKVDMVCGGDVYGHGHVRTGKVDW